MDSKKNINLNKEIYSYKKNMFNSIYLKELVYIYLMNELKKILIKNNYTCSDQQCRKERAAACVTLGPDFLNRDLQRLVLSFIAVIDIKKNNFFIKQEKDYIVQIELNDIDEMYVKFVLKRIYKNKEFELINEKRRKYNI